MCMASFGWYGAVRRYEGLPLVLWPFARRRRRWRIRTTPALRVSHPQANPFFLRFLIGRQVRRSGHGIFLVMNSTISTSSAGITISSIDAFKSTSSILSSVSDNHTARTTLKCPAVDVLGASNGQPSSHMFPLRCSTTLQAYCALAQAARIFFDFLMPVALRLF